MTSILEKREEIKAKISDYIDENNVKCETTLFKNEYFTSVDFEIEEKEENGITYVFPKMKEEPSSKEIADALVNRFLIDNKVLGFKPDQLIFMEDKFHQPLLKEALAAYTLNKDIRQIKDRTNFNIIDFCSIFEKSGDTREMSNNGKLIQEGFNAVLLGSIDSEHKVNIPTVLAIAEKMGTPEGKELMKNEIGEDKQERISSITPRLKESYIKNKNKLPS